MVTATRKGKRGQGDGSIRQQPNGTWEARITIDGTSRSFRARTRREVQAKLDAAREAARQGMQLPARYRLRAADRPLPPTALQLVG